MQGRGWRRKRPIEEVRTNRRQGLCEFRFIPQFISVSAQFVPVTPISPAALCHVSPAMLKMCDSLLPRCLRGSVPVPTDRRIVTGCERARGGQRLPPMRKQLTPFWILFTLTGLNLLNYLGRYVVYAVRTPLANDFHSSHGDSGRTVTASCSGISSLRPSSATWVTG